MPVDANAIQKWANGNLSNTVEADEGNPYDEEMAEDEMANPDEEEAGERNVLWAGESDKQDFETEVSEEEATELLTFLEENEPDIYGAVMELADALDQEDDAAVDQAKETLLWATQNLQPTYPAMSEAQRERASDLIAEHIGHVDQHASREQAIAIGMSQARAGE